MLTGDVCFRYVWCLDFKGGLFCSPLPETGLTWQRFEDNVHQVALSPSGELLTSQLAGPLFGLAALVQFVVLFKTSDASS